MPDYTDKQLASMEKELNKIYAEAQKDLQSKQKAYIQRAKKRTDKLYNELLKAKASGDSEKIKEAKDAYEKALYNVTFKNNRYKELVNQMTTKLSDTNQIALDYLNGKMPKIYCHSYNEFAENKIAGYSFDLVNENAIKNLVEAGDKNLLPPPKKLDIPKDERWNTKNINSQVMQGILQGESIDKIAKRLNAVVGMNKNSSYRNARTMTTGAENKGRQDSFEKATNDGVIMTRIWVAATGDGRTRDWHRDLNGVEVGIDEPFENAMGKIMYPGDPSADPSNVYNCRCAIRAKIKGFDWRKNKEDEVIEETTTSDERPVVDGHDISDTWQRRPDMFEFEIEDVLNAQGFDGLPKVVSSEEFDRYINESNFVAQRTYAAPDQITLDDYKDQLYNGKWYVDCSTGGSAYGQGMYCAANYDGTLTDKVKQEMLDYQKQNIMYTSRRLTNEERKQLVFDQLSDDLKSNPNVYEYLASAENGLGDFSILKQIQYSELLGDDVTKQLDKILHDLPLNNTPVHTVETFTIDKSAKIIDYDELSKMHVTEGSKMRIVSRTIKDANLTNEELAYVMIDYNAVMRNGTFSVEELKEITKIYDGLDKKMSVEELRQNYNKVISKIDFSHVDEEVKKGEKLREMDLGSYAALKGYDAIRTVHGTCGSDTIILNRTKVIFKGEK